MLRNIDALSLDEPRSDELRRTIKHARSTLAFVKQKEAIDKAQDLLAPYENEFRALARDQEAYLQRARAVFAEEKFNALGFSKEEVRRALDHAGYRPGQVNQQETVDSLLASILHLADKPTRSFFHTTLMASLPDFVAEGRMLEGFIVLDCAYAMIESPDLSNACLFTFFSRGYDEWADEQRSIGDRFLNEIGMTREQFEAMGSGELDAWIAKQIQPGMGGRLKAFFEACPGLKEQSIADLRNMQRDSPKLLERADARTLLLSREEIAPWLPRLSECFGRGMDTLPAERDSFTEDEKSRIFDEFIVPVLREMSGAIFTGERIQKLVEQLHAYRSERFREGEKEIASLAHGAISYIKYETEPDKNGFLTSLCMASIRAAWGELETSGGDA